MSIRLSQLLFSTLIIWACPSNSDQTESFNQMPSDLTFDEDFLDFNDDEFDEEISSSYWSYVVPFAQFLLGIEYEISDVVTFFAANIESHA